MLVRAEDRLSSLNTVRVPAGVEDGKVRKTLLEKFSIEISGGLGPLAGKIFRIGLMGSSSTPENLHRLLEALEAALQGFCPAAPGAAVAAAERVLYG
jgi:alanine-glyoxylate transaminase/serine-glyoxylate transaminase/serine-pyruvate transaminase